MSLQWNVDDQHAAQRQQQAQQEAKAAAQQRAALAADLGYWREVQRQLGPALEAARAEHAQAEADKDRRWAAYVIRYHALQRGRTPRQGAGGLPVVLVPTEGQHPQTLADWPGRAEHTAFKKAEAALAEALARLNQLERDRASVEHNIRLCTQAARG